MPDTTATTTAPGGFFGTDGFNLSDLGFLLDMGTDTFANVYGAINGNPGGGSYPAGFVPPVPVQNNTGLYVGIGIIVLMLAVLVFVIARK